MKLKIGNRIYEICDKCGSFISSPRCLSCNPIKGDEEWVLPEIKNYYEEKLNEDRIKMETSSNKNDEVAIPILESINDYTPLRRRLPEVQYHHLLEYFYTAEVLKRFGLYYGVDKKYLLCVRTRDHHRMINGLKLHANLYGNDSNGEMCARLSDPEKLLAKIPANVIQTFLYQPDSKRRS